MADDWGPLARLAGEWEGDGGLDAASAHGPEHASTLGYEVTITFHDDDTWSYDETTMLRMDELPEPLAHTDRNRLRRVS